MIKKYKWHLIASSVVILLPMLFGFFAVKYLPETFTDLLGISGVVNGATTNEFFFILPLILLAIHLICLSLTALINKNNEQNSKLTIMMFWIIPFIALSVCGIVFAVSLGYISSIYSFIIVLLSILFIVVGNFLPKTTRNITMGIKIKWTILSDDNWNVTHRFAGKVYVIIGFTLLLALFLPSDAFPYVALVLILTAIFLPTIYSYKFYKKQLTDGTLNISDADKIYGRFANNKKSIKIATAIFLSVIFIIVAILMFTGDISTTLNEDSFTIKATYWSDITLKYNDIDSIEYYDEGVDGERISGVGSARLLLGKFRNNEFGVYTRYTYNKDVPCIVLKVDNEIIVLSAQTEQEVEELYNRLNTEIKK